MQSAINHVIDACHSARKPVGILAKDAADTNRWFDRGVPFVAAGIDSVCHLTALTQLVRDCRRD